MGFSTEIVDKWVEIWNNYNLDKVRELFLDDERVTYFSSEKQGLIKGIDNLVEHHREFGFVEGGNDNGNKLWLEDVAVDDFGDMVLVKADWIFQRKGSDKHQRGPVTMAYLEQNKNYKIVHCHFSNY
jgi:ketosteroid isomerase-like protein